MRLLLATALVLAGCAPKPETPEQAQTRIASESADAKRAIDSLNTEFVAHFNAAHGDLVAAQYADDGELAVAGQQLIKGRKDIAGFVAGLGQMKATLKLTATSVQANGPIAIERGDYTLSVSPPGAPQALTETGTFLVHWHKINGAWLRVHDVATTPSPLPPPPAAQPAKK
jgi:ketosteroid isomerase-like protein